MNTETPDAHTWVETMLRQLTLEEKVGQMFFAAFTAEHLAEGSPEWQRLERLVQQWHVGGFHLWRGEPYAAVALTNHLQKLSRVPLLFEADFEHGTGWRFPGGVDFPPAMAIAATGDTTFAYEMGRITGLEARAMGIHLTFAPVVDVNSNPFNPIINTRSFGERPEQVARFARAFIKGAHESGLLTTAKHFPGHGDTGMDSHLVLATIDGDSSRLFSLELPPFQAAIAAGVDAIMSAHIYLPRWNMPPYTPATLSREILTDLLRTRLGFDGLIFTDAMEMYAVHHNYTERYAAVAAVQAGADIVLVSPDIPSAITAVVQAVRSGRIPESRINATVRRILQAKARVGLHRNKYVSAETVPGKLGGAESQEIALRAAQRAITLLRNENSLLPLKADQIGRPVAVVPVYPQSNTELHQPFVNRLRSVFDSLTVDMLTPQTAESCAQPLLDKVRRASLVIMPVFAYVQAYQNGIDLPPVVAQICDGILRSEVPVLLVSFGSPYIIQAFEAADGYLVAYGQSALMQEAAADAILGRAPITGTIPVSFPGFFQRGDGLRIESAVALAPRPVPEPAPRLRIGLPDEAGFDMQGLLAVDSLMQQAVRDSVFPGAVLLVARNGVIALFEAYGRMGYGDFDRPMPKNAIFDLASLTKVVATTTAAMLLVQEGRLDLDATVQSYLPGFTGPGKSSITIRHLLTHSSGLPPFKRYFLEELKPGEIIDRILQEPLEYAPGSDTRYSDLGIILLGKIIEKISGQSLDQFCRERIFEPLGMVETAFNPPSAWYERIPPTEKDPWRGRIVHGVVHDENAYALGGVAGHAGLFSSARDLAIFAQMLLNGGRYGETELLSRTIIEEFTRRQNMVSGSTRALGWDTQHPDGSCGTLMSPRAFGHTGFTGTSLWIDPDNQLIVVLLSNRVHPTRENRKIIQFRPRLHDAVMRALSGS